MTKILCRLTDHPGASLGRLVDNRLPRATGRLDILCKLLADYTMPLPEPMSTCHQRCSVAFTLDDLVVPNRNNDCIIALIEMHVVFTLWLTLVRTSSSIRRIHYMSVTASQIPGNSTAVSTKQYGQTLLALRRQPDCCYSSFLKLTRKTSKLSIIDPLWGETTGDWIVVLQTVTIIVFYRKD